MWSNRNIVNIMCCSPDCKTDNNKSSGTTEKKCLFLHVSSTLFRCRSTSFIVGHTSDCCAPYWSMGNCGTFLLSEHGAFTRPSPPVLTQKDWYCFVTNKTITIFLSQNKFIEAWQRQTPRIFNWLTNIFRVKMRRTSKPVGFNLFHAATHFANQFNLTNPSRKFPVRHMKCSCVCTIENHNDYKITYNITVLNQDSFVKFMHMAAPVRETRAVAQITPQHNSSNTRI